MTNRSNDDIADALRGLSGGDPAEPDPHEARSPAETPPPAAPTPTAPPGVPAPTQPGGAPMAAQFRSGAKPLPKRPTPQPHPPKPSGPSAASNPAPPPAARPGVPDATPRAARPAQPASTSAAPARPPTPVPRQPPAGSMNLAPPPAANPAPGASPGGFTSDDETTDVRPVDEDDVVMVPAARLSSLGPRPQHRPAAAGVPLFKTLAFRQTAIPVLLTSAVLMLAVAAMKFVVHPDSILALLPGWMRAALAGAALLFFIVALLNMTHVRQQLRDEKAGARPPGS